ncbi:MULTISPECIES: hypothetical protein [Caballeronia]|uniref:hypothetical protein n=1 Tax=Caballeronia TaxID=1827195 RepID=UPI00158844B4|nr:MULTISPECIES: hypothetical protein [Caballeronia]MCG7402181.1 hypothetical protein [Caballeronia zhejiangensis]MCI1042413.1 hypothetical protein [Caballeronia zhejiangensis]
MRKHTRRDPFDTRFRQDALQRSQGERKVFASSIEFEPQFAAFTLRLTHVDAKRRMKQRAYAFPRRFAIREMRKRQNPHTLTCT